MQQLKSGDIASTAPDPRVAEYELLASGRQLIGVDSPDALLHATTLLDLPGTKAATHY